MAGKDIIRMSGEELRRVSIVKQALDSWITQKEAIADTGIILPTDKETCGKDKGRRRKGAHS